MEIKHVLLMIAAGFLILIFGATLTSGSKFSGGTFSNLLGFIEDFKDSRGNPDGYEIDLIYERPNQGEWLLDLDAYGRINDIECDSNPTGFCYASHENGQISKISKEFGRNVFLGTIGSVPQLYTASLNAIDCYFDFCDAVSNGKVGRITRDGTKLVHGTEKVVDGGNLISLYCEEENLCYAGGTSEILRYDSDLTTAPVSTYPNLYPNSYPTGNTEFDRQDVNKIQCSEDHCFFLMMVWTHACSSTSCMDPDPRESYFYSVDKSDMMSVGAPIRICEEISGAEGTHMCSDNKNTAQGDSDGFNDKSDYLVASDMWCDLEGTSKICYLAITAGKELTNIGGADNGCNGNPFDDCWANYQIIGAINVSDPSDIHWDGYQKIDFCDLAGCTNWIGGSEVAQHIVFGGYVPIIDRLGLLRISCDSLDCYFTATHIDGGNDGFIYRISRSSGGNYAGIKIYDNHYGTALWCDQVPREGFCFIGFENGFINKIRKADLR